jgi:hypothetical protein
MCHSFIRVFIAHVTRNLSTGNSRETARKPINKPTTTLAVSVKLTHEFTLPT